MIVTERIQQNYQDLAPLVFFNFRFSLSDFCGFFFSCDFPLSMPFAMANSDQIIGLYFLFNIAVNEIMYCNNIVIFNLKTKYIL